MRYTKELWKDPEFREKILKERREAERAKLRKGCLLFSEFKKILTSPTSKIIIREILLKEGERTCTPKTREKKHFVFPLKFQPGNKLERFKQLLGPELISWQKKI